MRECNIDTFSVDDWNLFSQPESNCYLTLFKIIHCSQNRPQYHNIFYPPKQTQKMFVYTTERKWKEQSSIKTINDVLLGLRNELVIFLENNKGNNEKIRSYVNMIDPVLLTKKNFKKCGETIMHLHKDIRLMLRNYSYIIVDTFARTNCDSLLSKSSSDDMIEKKKPKSNNVKSNKYYKGLRIDDTSESSSESESSEDIPKSKSESKSKSKSKSKNAERAVYIVTTCEQRKKNRYKVGKHTGSFRKLESRYITPLVDPIICFFYPSEYAAMTEKKVKKQFDSFRIVNKNGTKTEWFQIDLKVVISAICDIELALKGNNPIDKFIDDCFVVTDDLNDRLQMQMVAKLLPLYDIGIDGTVETISQGLTEKGVRIETIKGVVICCGLKFRDCGCLKKVLPEKCVDYLLSRKLVGRCVRDP